MSSKKRSLSNDKRFQNKNKNASSLSITTMFKRIESKDSNIVKCKYCNASIKSCLLQDHISTKCEFKQQITEKQRREREEKVSDVIFLCEEKSPTKNKTSPEFIKPVNNQANRYLNISSNSNSNISAIESKDVTPCKKIELDDSSRSTFSIFDNEEERQRYIKPENFTPIKHERLLEIGKLVPDETIQNEIIEILIEDSSSSSTESTQIDTVTLGLEVGTDKPSSPLATPLEQTMGLNELPVSKNESPVNDEIPSKRNFARKSTSSIAAKRFKEDEKKSQENIENNNFEIEYVTDSNGKNDEDRLLIELDLKQFATDITNTKNEPNSQSDKQKEEPKSNFCYMLRNFCTAIEVVIDQNDLSYLLNEDDISILNQFLEFKDESKKLYVRLFQRKFKWIHVSNINYDNISSSMLPYLEELKEKSFLIDENSIDSYEEVVYLLKLPQLKQLAKQFHILNSKTLAKGRRIDYINAILNHFNTQKGLNFSNVIKTQTNSLKSQYMNECRLILGKCYKLNKTIRDVFVRILMLYSLSSTHNADQSQMDSGQQQLLQILLANIGKYKFMDYEIKFDLKIFETRDCLIRYQEALEYEYEFFNLLEEKEYEEAQELFDNKMNTFKEHVKNISYNELDSILPNYLRKFTANSVYCKVMSIYASEILQRFKHYKRANEIFEFLLFEQNLYLLDSRAHWYERLAINYETHLKNPKKAVEILMKGLNDKQHVRKAGRFNLYQRVLKMTQIKRYTKVDNLIEALTELCEKEKYELEEAPTVTIEANILQPDIIPGRKVIFVQNNNPFQRQAQEDQQICGVEQIALSHYIKNGSYTHGKHAETGSIRTIFGLLFWDVVFAPTPNVFVDRFQTVPLDINTDHFYLNRKQLIDDRINQIKNGDTEFIFDIMQTFWNKYFGVECSLVNWDLFESLDELKSFIKCFTNTQLASLCEYIAKNFRYCRSGGPDLTMWSTESNTCSFIEIKGPGDKLSFKQLIWLDFFIKNSINCAVCYVKGTCAKRLRDRD